MKAESGSMAKRVLPALFVIVVMAIAFVAVILVISNVDVLPSGVTSSRSSSSNSLSIGSSTVVSGEASSTQTSPQTVTIIMPAGAANSDEIGYIPQFVTIVIGVNNTVTWVNDDSADHTVSGDSDTWGSGNMGPGQTYTYTFTVPGVYNYYCIYHSWMVGTITVKAA